MQNIIFDAFRRDHGRLVRKQEPYSIACSTVIDVEVLQLQPLQVQRKAEQDTSGYWAENQPVNVDGHRQARALCEIRMHMHIFWSWIDRQKHKLS